MSNILRPVNENQDKLAFLSQYPPLQFGNPVIQAPQLRLIRLDEINEERHHAYRQALANVYATLDPDQPVHLLYLLEGGPTGVNLYFGVLAEASNADLLHGALQNLRSALEGHLPGINFGSEIEPPQKSALLDRLNRSVRQGVVLGTPSSQDQDQASDEVNFQDMDRLVRALQSGTGGDTDSWQLLVVCQPLARAQIHQQLDAAYELSSRLADHTRTNLQLGGSFSNQVGTSSGSSESRGSNSSTSRTEGKNRSVTTGTNESITNGKNLSTTDGHNSGRSTSTNRGGSESWGSGSDRAMGHNSRSKSSGKSESRNHGTSTSHTAGKSTSHSSGTSVSRTGGTSTSDSHTEGLSLTRSTNEGSNQSDTTGQSLNVSKELTDKRAQHLADYLDKQLIPRLQKGLTKSLFHSAVYLAAENTALYQRLKNSMRATFQGSEATLCPLEVHDLAPITCSASQLLQLPMLDDPPSAGALLFRSLHLGAHRRVGSLLTADELAVVASLPQHELQGIRRRKAVEFVVDLPDAEGDALDLGAVVDRGRRYVNNRVRLIRKDLNKHVFITGVTGAGKTTTCLNLLLESDLPFLVIEPAKTEYRELATRLDDVDYYRPNGCDHQSLRINPFALIRKGQRIKSHAGFLKNVFAAVFPMEASMPMMVEAAILASYEDKGWDIDDNEFLLGGDPFDPKVRAWPTMSDMISQLDRILPTYGMGKEFEEKYRGSLVSRLRSLTDGTLGQVLDVPQSLSFDALLDRHAVIELEELQGGEEKALLMALLLGGINEAIRARHAREPSFRHLTLIEEAHRLLARPDQGDKATAMAVEAFADMLAEVRKYGEGLLIADQIPAKLIPDVIKNTHTKIVHRLFAEDDRRTMGESMMMDDEQRAFLPNLGTGEAIVFCGGWHGAAHAAIRNDHAQTDNHEKPSLDLVARGAQQLWRERARYYPQFCKLGWLAAGDNPQEFGQFVRDTRQAQRQLLRLVAAGSSSSHKEAAFSRLKKWHAQWHPRAQQLAGAWKALLLDANPRPHPDRKNVPQFSDSEFLTRTTETLMTLIAQSNSLSEWQHHIATNNAADLRAHLDQLTAFKSV